MTLNFPYLQSSLHVLNENYTGSNFQTGEKLQLKVRAFFSTKYDWNASRNLTVNTFVASWCKLHTVPWFKYRVHGRLVDAFTFVCSQISAPLWGEYSQIYFWIICSTSSSTRFRKRVKCMQTKFSSYQMSLPLIDISVFYIWSGHFSYLS